MKTAILEENGFVRELDFTGVTRQDFFREFGETPETIRFFHDCVAEHFPTARKLIIKAYRVGLIR